MLLPAFGDNSEANTNSKSQLAAAASSREQKGKENKKYKTEKNRKVKREIFVVVCLELLITTQVKMKTDVYIVMRYL
jgi:hypothetical protein